MKLKALMIIAFSFMSCATSIFSMDMIPGELKAFYAENEEEINKLKESVLNPELEAKVREESLIVLRAKYNHVVFPLALRLLELEDSSLDVEAIQIVARNAVMSDHLDGFEKGYHPTESQKMMLKHHYMALKMLRKAVLSSDPKVRDIAAKLISSLSDSEGLEAINEGEKEGIYSGSEALSYFAGAKPEIAENYIIQRLDGNDQEARVAATYYAARIPSLKKKVLSIAVSRGETDKVRIAAVQGLSDFSGAANSLLSIALDNKSESNLAKTAAKAYAEALNSRAEKGETTELEAGSAIEAFKNKDQEMFFPAIKELEILQAEIETGLKSS